MQTFLDPPIICTVVRIFCYGMPDCSPLNGSDRITQPSPRVFPGPGQPKRAPAIHGPLSGLSLHFVHLVTKPRSMARQSGRDRRILIVARHRSQAHRDFTAAAYTRCLRRASRCSASHPENCARHFDPVTAARWNRPWTGNSSSTPRRQSACHLRKTAPQTTARAPPNGS
jgi:hypothetical protein